MSSKERTTDKKIDRLVTVKFLYDQRITELDVQLVHELALAALRPETTPEAKRPKTALGPGSWDRSSRGGAGAGAGAESARTVPGGQGLENHG